MTYKRVGYLDAIMMRIESQKVNYPLLLAKYSLDQVKSMLRAENITGLSAAKEWCTKEEASLKSLAE